MGVYAKFWVAIVMMVANFIRSYWAVDLGVDETTASTLVGGVTAALVWAVPNR